MKPTETLQEKGKLFLVVMMPILITQIGLYAMNFFDTVMSGQAGANDLAGVAIGSSLWVPVFTGLNGVLLALTPIIAQSIGAEKRDDVPYVFLQGLYLSIAISIAVILIGAVVLDPILSAMSLEDEVGRIAKEYLIGLAFGIVPLFIYTTIRCLIDSLGETRVTMFITLLSLPINIFFNYVLIFGKLGFPRLGGVGAGYASAITYWFILAVAIVVVVKVRPFTDFQLFKKLYHVSLKKWKEILLLGLPIGFTIFFETSIFAAVTLLMSTFDTATIAAHQAAVNFASFLYMIPLSIAFTLTIAVGYEVGAKRVEDARQYSRLGITFALIMGLVAGVIIYVLRAPVASLYTNDSQVAWLIQQFLIYSIFFQLSDALATPIQGVLRGHKDVNVPFVMALVSFWIIGLPTGYLLANFSPLGPYGYWIGLITGLASCAIALSWRLKQMQRKFERAARLSQNGNS
ncbi:MATE family efflux transporter [Halalkalibacterium halodurans]|jgi:MATE family multidrug resistance protein|uniref:Probable multidrug resistance protein NorM n=2 Tax=Halalkalibacterium halodurans TaxID=86665 RepID=NORM_HALH5|nr:MATE family efflux transporter [Halalkalibacterium halodurans]Q9KEJ2.1 RecName: Full=Probable multidrug resistance protein NorM; AltName: Full=Multidrug-efflux transporter [Halalkalibacterium halodurans C-125]MED3648345.1 MATE family efflux transporter [Halalkalibacterium halodurans]MED4080777.1 MATE family efflux transporter [Halalkalibacterium halodurans]MED4086234.1 MATE family efflux transporter [Halalkalibacterium halodurans]MED4106916.1 MATE family efflux transporter [Halalkalibacteri